TLISRVLGLLREAVFAYLYGSSNATDAFNVAFRIPNLLRDLFAETALSAGFIPVFTEIKEKEGNEKANLLAANIFNTLFVFAGIVVILGIILSPILVRILAPGFGQVTGKLGLTSNLTRITFPFLFFISLAAWAMGLLNSHKVFFIPSLAPAIFNILSVAIPLTTYALFVQAGINPIFAMAIGVVVGGLGQFLIQLPVVLKKGFRFRFLINLKDPRLRLILTLLLPVIAGLAATRINVAVDMLLISLLESKSLTYINYAYRVMHLPIGLLGVAISTVALPTLSRAVALSKLEELKRLITESLDHAFILTIPATIYIGIFSTPICRFIFEHGRFLPIDTQYTSQALLLYIIGVPFIAASKSLASTFYSIKRPRIPMIGSIYSVILNIGLNLSLMWSLRFRAFPLSTSISSAFYFIYLAITLSREIPDLRFKGLVPMIVRSLLFGGLAGGAGYLFFSAIDAVLIIKLLAAFLVLGLVYYLAARFFGDEMTTRIIKRFLTI
ncbi:MAG TPA: murein biosynthesis integral membrane protein MurJ, partial [bacterium (Candidatus Stahlbacteria)]|nr:murein biosynthesis integral membrane protein MurJ [Candidatus Stahlbacteria bacterium]